MDLENKINSTSYKYKKIINEDNAHKKRSNTHLYSSKEHTEQKVCSQVPQVLEQSRQRTFSQKLQEVVKPSVARMQHRSEQKSNYTNISL